MYQFLLIACCAVPVTVCASLSNVTLYKDDSHIPKQTAVSKKLKDQEGITYSNSTKNSKQDKTVSLPKSYETNKSGKSFPEKHSEKGKNSLIADHAQSLNNTQKPPHILFKIHHTLTRSKDAVWATMTLTFMCVILFLAVAQSRMWKNYHGSEMPGVTLPNFDERVPFREVMERKTRSLREFFQKRKEKRKTELECLLPPSEWD
ncbi:hypothetical protein X975_13852, partial [Stegodyphus mimosarum]